MIVSLRTMRKTLVDGALAKTALFALLVVWGPPAHFVIAADYYAGDPSAAEQYFLELVNRARLNPSAEAVRRGMDLNQNLAANTITTSAKQPLAFHYALLSAARAHSQWMIDTDIFSHTGNGGSTIAQRASAAGYPTTGAYIAENIGASTFLSSMQATVDYIHEGLYESASHRVNIFRESVNETGIGLASGDFNFGSSVHNALMATQDFANSPGTPGPLLTGVVYGDLDGDNFYDIGEGINGAKIVVEGAAYTATTNAAGHWTIPVPGNGYYTVTATLPGYSPKSTGVNISGGLNAKVDFYVSGSTVVAASSAYGFGLLTEVAPNRYWSDTYGYLSFGDNGNNRTWAWSESLQVWLATDGSNVHSADYGWLTPGSNAGWVKSSKLGWIRIHSHGSATMPDSSPWVWSITYGWVISNRSGTGQYFWCHRLRSWLSAGANGSIWSFDYGWMTPGANAGWANTSSLGWIYIGDFNGWVWSSRFGWVVSNKSGTATFFWSNSYGWLAANGAGGVWSYTFNRWL